jgi:2-polyprenyl-3-methyl-5-hydroxy-6-metoxy-1,4-benzoquinol methylase
LSFFVPFVVKIRCRIRFLLSAFRTHFMDHQTIQVYDQKAASIAARHRGNKPNRLNDLVLTYFHAGELTADVGCGSGRDTEWLHHQGFPTIGYDGSEGMLVEARLLNPMAEFHVAFLPDLVDIPDGHYLNVLCNAVLMHLSKTETPTALRNLARIMRPGGRLIVSFRGSQDVEEREADGRLYTRIQLDEMMSWMEAADLKVLVSETIPDPVRIGGEWSMAVAER